MRHLALFTLVSLLGLSGCECNAMPFTLRVKRSYPDSYAKLCPANHNQTLHASR